MSTHIATAVAAARAGLSVAYVAPGARHSQVLAELADLVSASETLVVNRTVGRGELRLLNGGAVRLVVHAIHRATTDVVVFDRVRGCS